MSIVKGMCVDIPKGTTCVSLKTGLLKTSGGYWGYVKKVEGEYAEVGLGQDGANGRLIVLANHLQPCFNREVCGVFIGKDY